MLTALIRIKPRLLARRTGRTVLCVEKFSGNTPKNRIVSAFHRAIAESFRPKTHLVGGSQEFLGNTPKNRIVSAFRGAIAETFLPAGGENSTVPRFCPTWRAVCLVRVAPRQREARTPVRVASWHGLSIWGPGVEQKQTKSGRARD